MKRLLKPGFWLTILVCALMIYQVRLLNQTGGYVDLQEIEELQQEARALENTIGQSRTKIRDLEQELEAINSKNPETEIARILRNDLNRYRMYSGLTAVQGEGIVIIIDDGDRVLFNSENPNDLVVHDLDIRRIVDELRIAGAEAISVNGNRIIMGVTEIICNGPTIRINGVQQAPPYVVRAIGDRFRLEGKMRDVNAFVHALSQFGLDIEVSTKVQLTIDKLAKQTQLKYAEVVK